MRVFNYSNYAKTLEIAIINPNMTKIAKALFEPIISKEFVLNHVGKPYTIDSRIAKFWYQQTIDIPKNLKKAASHLEIYNSIANYFSDKIIDELINKIKEKTMYSEMIKLILDSDLETSIKKELLSYYEDGDTAEFLGKAFLFAIIGDNLKKDSTIDISSIEKEIQTFKKIIKEKIKKPTPINPPDEIVKHEIIYVQALYKVYSEKTGKCYKTPDDLKFDPILNNNFKRQRKSYYLAETIRREIRDTILLDEIDSFDILKEEIYEGIIETNEKDYKFALDRLNAVMEHVTTIPLSHNLNDILLDWIGSGEKKGVCHMLVNDKRINWIKEDDNHDE